MTGLTADVQQAVDDAVAAAISAREISLINRAIEGVRAEYTVMPRFGFHQPLDYTVDTSPPDFGGPPIYVDGEVLPLPPAMVRYGYPDDHAQYLSMGRDHYLHYLAEIKQYRGLDRGMTLMEFGCSTGRVLRHFYEQKSNLDWKLIGCDTQALHIEWLRQFWPQDICVYTGSVYPKLPFEDNSIDIILGMSVFTHIKYLWDFWLLELRRVLKPGGLLLQTIHAEKAWKFYYDNRHLDWVQSGISPIILDSPEMNIDYLLCGDIAVSQTFWKKDVARKYWGRYFDVLDVLSPVSPAWFQDMMVCRK